MKKLFIYLLLILVMAMPAHAAITAGVGDIVRPTAYWWSGRTPLDSTGDLGLGWMQEVEGDLEGTTAFDNQLIFNEISTPSNPDANIGSLYVADATGTTTLFFLDSAGTATNLLTVGSGVTLDGAYDQGGAGSGRTVTVDSGAVAFTTTDAANNTGLIVTQADTAAATAVQIVGSQATANAIGLDIDSQTTGRDIEGTGASWFVSGLGDIEGNSLTVTNLFESALVAASSGNVALTIDAAGNGTITLGTTSTGAITHVRATSFTAALTANGDVTLGNAATDNITPTGEFVANIVLDDDSTDSPSVIYWDAGENDWIFLKANGATGNLTATSDAATSDFQIITGNLKVGAGTETTTLNGDDAYITGTFEVDGAIRFDGAVTTFANLTATLGATELYKLDAASTITTTTAGVLDMDVTSATANNKAIYIDYELDDGSSGTQYGVYIDLDDDAAGADETFHALSVLNSAGTNATTIGLNIANTIDTGVNIVAGVAAVAIAIDAAATDHTGATGVVDIEFDSITDNSEAVNIKATAIAGGSGQSVAGMEIELDNDSDNGSDVLYGLIVNVTDSTATGTETAIYVKGTGVAAALQADFGYIRIGTGASPDVSPGDDDLFVEGTVEVDGAARFDGAITTFSTVTGDGSAALFGYLTEIEIEPGTAETLTAADSGKTFTNTAAQGNTVYTLPAAAAGLIFTFVDDSSGAGDDVQIQAVGDDTINNGTAAKIYECTTDATKQTVTIEALDAIRWIIKSEVGTWVNNNS